MKYKECSVGMSKTINIGNYESIRIESSVTVSLDEGETPEGVLPQMQDQLKMLLRDTYRQQYAKKVAEES